jgi:hypothetical protein
MAKETHIQSTIVQNPDGTTKEIIVEQIEVDVPTQEEIIAEKEAELLKLYKALEELKQK